MMTILYDNSDLNNSNRSFNISQNNTNHNNQSMISSSSRSTMLSPDQQVPKGKGRVLTKVECDIIKTIDSCFKNWYEPWKETYLANGREFKKIYEIMEELFHYENLIRESDSPLTIERTEAFAKIVAKYVDYGNAILNIDMIIRANDRTSSEIDLGSVTTIELFQAHIYSHNWREKLLYDYFKKDRPNSIGDNNTTQISYDYDTTSNNASPTINQLLSSSYGTTTTSAFNSIAQQQQQQQRHLSPPNDKNNRSSISPRASIGSADSFTSPAGRKTPQPTVPNQFGSEVSSKILQTHIQQQPLPSPQSSSIKPIEVLNKQIEIGPLITILKSEAFFKSETTRASVLPEILNKIESLMSATMQQNFEKITSCFELLGTFLDCVEKLPPESRKNEVVIIANKLLKPIIRKIYTDERDKYIEFQHAYWTTFFISIIRLMDCEDFENYLRHFNSLADVGAFINDYLHLVQQLMSTTNDKNSTTIHAELENINKLWRIYPFYWIEMTLLACSTFLNSLTFIYKVLRQYFKSNLRNWSNFIECLISFMVQDTLKPNRLMLKDRHRHLADDLTQKCAEYVWISWDSLNQDQDQKQEIIEVIIKPLIEACMTLKTKQRQILLPIFYDMMRCDYTSQYITPRSSIYGSSSASTIRTIASQNSNSGNNQQAQRITINNDYVDHSTFDLPTTSNNLRPIQHQAINLVPSKQIIDDEELPYLRGESSTKSDDGTVLTNFTHLIVEKLNNLMIEDKRNLGDELFKHELCAAIAGDLNPKYYNINNFLEPNDISQFKSMAKHTADLIAEFMQICLDYRQANKLSYRHLYLLCVFKLILFFRDKVDLRKLYINYLFTLFRLHHGSDRYAEAGYTLLELVNKLPWSEKTIEAQYRFLNKKFQLQTNDYMSLKIVLYNTIMDLFNKAQLWEEAIPLCRKLMDIYQFETFEYEKLALVLQSMSQYFHNIATLSQVRDIPEYFRVSFYGNGFPKSIRDLTVVYRGKPFERLADFNATILTKYPDATLLKTLVKPSDEDLKSNDARYIQISSCAPIVDLQSKFDKNLAKIQESLLVYYRYNDCDKFSYDRRISSPYKHIGLTNNQQLKGDDVGNIWLERTTLSTNRLPGILPFFEVYLTETSLVSPIESAIECMERRNEQLSCMVNRFKADRRFMEDVRILDSLISGTIDAAVNGGITKYEEAFFVTAQPAKVTFNGTSLESNFANLQIPSSTDGFQVDTHHKNNNNNNDNNKQGPPNYCLEPPIAFADNNDPASGSGGGGGVTMRGNVNYHQPNAVLVDKLKCLIAQQVPLLDEALKLHRDRIADVMRERHEYLETSYKKLKLHIMTKYSRYLPQEYNRSTTRSYRSLARSPNRSVRSDSRLQLNSGTLSSVNSNNNNNAVDFMSTSGLQAPTRIKRFSEIEIRSSMQRDINQVPSNGLIIDGTGRNDIMNKQSSINTNTSKIPYQQFESERRSLPFLTGLPTSNVSVEDKNRIHQNDSIMNTQSTSTKTTSKLFQAAEALTPDSGLDVSSSQNLLDVLHQSSSNFSSNTNTSTLIIMPNNNQTEIENNQTSIGQLECHNDNRVYDFDNDNDDEHDCDEDSIIESGERVVQDTNSNNNFSTQLYTRLLSTPTPTPSNTDNNRETKESGAFNGSDYASKNDNMVAVDSTGTKVRIQEQQGDKMNLLKPDEEENLLSLL